MTMSDFSTLLDTYLSRLSGKHSPVLLTEVELGELTLLAKASGDAHPADWAKFARVLAEFTDLTDKGAKQTFRECRLIADLGAYPYSVTEFVPLFLKSRGHRMKFSGEFTNSADADFIQNQMMIWSHEILGGGAVFSDAQIKAAFPNWQVTEKDRLLADAFHHVSYDPSADPLELTGFATLMTAPTAGDPAKTARDIRACEIALRNFIYRVKNHMRQTWRHGSHLMPVFYGPQGSGKTTAVRHLLSPIRDFSSAVGFDLFEHDAKLMKLSVTPVMFFDEMAGITKAENERLKDFMHSESRELRRLYGAPVNRTLVSTFIGCSNKDISTLIRDETGNRRYLQIETPRLDRDEIMKFDALAMWRSVDENAEAPLYANADDLKAVLEVQAEQRHLGKVEHWLNECRRHPEDGVPASLLFTDHYLPWASDMYPGQERFENLIAFGKELNRLVREGHPRLRVKHGKATKLYTVLPAGIPTPERPAMGVVVNFADQAKRPSGPVPEPLTRLRKAMREARAREDLF